MHHFFMDNKQGSNFWDNYFRWGVGWGGEAKPTCACAHTQLLLETSNVLHVYEVLNET